MYISYAWNEKNGTRLSMYARRIRDLVSLLHLKGDKMSSKEGEKHDSFLVWLEPKSRLNEEESRHYFKSFQRGSSAPGC